MKNAENDQIKLNKIKIKAIYSLHSFYMKFNGYFKSFLYIVDLFLIEMRIYSDNFVDFRKLIPYVVATSIDVITAADEIRKSRHNHYGIRKYT